VSNTRRMRRQLSRAKEKGKRPFEVALDINGNPLHGSPWSDAAVHHEDVGDYFFYPVRIKYDKGPIYLDIVVLAENKEDAIMVARKELERIKEAGKWGRDHLSGE